MYPMYCFSKASSILTSACLPPTFFLSLVCDSSLERNPSMIPTAKSASSSYSSLAPNPPLGMPTLSLSTSHRPALVDPTWRILPAALSLFR